MNRQALPVAAAAVAMFAMVSPLTVAGEQQGLKPYSAEYKTTARGMALKLNRKLEANGDGSYTLTNGGKIMVVGFHEMSVFSVDGAAIIPKSYVYQGTGLINRRREVHFTPGSDTIRSLYKEQWYDLPYKEGTLDRMSQQEQVRLFLLNDPTPKEDILITVADGKRVKDYQLKYVGEETLDTPLGKLDTLHFERIHDDPDRKSDTWVAPGLDYLMVKTVHVEDGKPVEAILTKASVGN
ncbi:DUF3108 domain-containing protein [Seongchinamella unica]|nr:DUF3108 domain-containing protein [Seongchinamella unica]